jgi:NAD(P)-dependent dehydrogenase (short-subunit alcohol dehydrogenase family)
MKIDLHDKVAVVTGAAGGIGKGIAKLLLENSARVIITDVKDEEGAKTAAEFSKIGDCKYVHLDITDIASVDKFIDQAVGEYKKIDIFINNAGTNTPGQKRRTIDDFPVDEWHRVVGVDLNGTFYCARAAARIMVKQKSGRIVNIGSVFGSVPARLQIAYVAAKAGVHNFTKGMALELAPHGINVNAVAPGSILTEGTRDLFYGNDAAQKEFRERMLSHVPIGQPGETEDIANAVLFLCGRESKYITGHVLTVDGGWTCGYFRDF